MREIKFRGFRNFKGNALYPSDKRWIYGYYYFNAGKHWIKNKADMAQTFVVEEDSIGEFTGRKDKNGKEEYEGDIVAVDRKDSFSLFNRASIIYAENHGSFMLQYTRPIKYSEGILAECSITSEDKTILFGNCTGWEIEIIGNTYEHPELLSQ